MSALDQVTSTMVATELRISNELTYLSLLLQRGRGIEDDPAVYRATLNQLSRQIEQRLGLRP
jgi:hypothetical protein